MPQFQLQLSFAGGELGALVAFVGLARRGGLNGLACPFGRHHHPSSSATIAPPRFTAATAQTTVVLTEPNVDFTVPKPLVRRQHH
jgi:hypothetical protein